MRIALKQAHLALKHNEVPVGCVIVWKNQVIAKAFNRTNVELNATRHCEFVAIDQIMNAVDESTGKKRFDKSILKKCTLYVTVEPCIMCASALNLVRIGKIYFGCHNERFGGCGSVLHLHKSRYVILLLHEYNCFFCNQPNIHTHIHTYNQCSAFKISYRARHHFRSSQGRGYCSVEIILLHGKPQSTRQQASSYAYR